MSTPTAKKAILVAAHPIWNVPPFVNVATQLAKHGYRVIVIGYHRSPLPRLERITDSAWILRLNIKYRSIRIGPLRKVASLFEFNSKVKSILSRIKPDLSLVFNDPTTLVLQHARRNSRIAACWLLEYPEVDLAGWLEGTLLNWCKRSWHHSDIFVTPHTQRMALHLSQRPECLENICLTVHNSPPREHPSKPLGGRGSKAIQILKRAKEQGRTRFIYAGAVGIRYGIQELLKAIMNAPNSMVMILGKKHELAVSEVSAIVPDFQNNDCIHWIDEIPYSELHAVIPHADVGFAYYQGENLNTRFAAPGKLYEYLAAGLAVVISEGQEIAPAIKATESGYVLQHPLRIEELGRAIKQSCDDQERLQAMKKNARQLFEDQYCLERQITPFINALQGSS